MGGRKKARGRTNRTTHKKAKHEKAEEAADIRILSRFDAEIESRMEQHLKDAVELQKAQADQRGADQRGADRSEIESYHDSSEEALAGRLLRHPGATHGATLTDRNAPGELLADKLIDFVEHASVAIKLNAYSWMENELGINVARRDWVNVNTVELAAAAERGDPKAQFSLVLMSVTEGVGSPADRNRWVDNALTNGDPTSIEWSSITLWYGLQGVSIILGVHDETSPGARRQALDNLQTAAECGSATAQYIFGMLKLWSGFKSSGMFTFEMETSRSLDAWRWIRKAAKQGVVEAQSELGKMFGYADIGGIVHMRLARKYTRQASVQRHDEATRFMKQLRMCVLCGADDARRTCSLCREVRYCDSTCSRKHWYEGGVMSREGGAMSEEPDPHMDVCRRTHVRGRQPR